jgi:hypothetical protein
MSNEPEFTDTFDRPAWWHRQQWLATQPAVPQKCSKPTPAWEDPTRIRVAESPVVVVERSRVRPMPRPARTGLSVPRPRQWSTKAGKPHTYLIKADGSHLVKIGIATDPMQRLKTLQTGQPMDLYLIWSVPGDYEYDLHVRFAEYRHRGEWFDLRELGDPVTVVTDAINEIRA